MVLTLKSILSSIIGSSFYQWFQGTTLGIWFQKQVDRFMEYFAEKYELELMKKDAKFRKNAETKRASKLHAFIFDYYR